MKKLQISEFITSDECKKFIDDAEVIGFETAGIRTANGEVSRPDLRNNGRVILEDESIAEYFFNKMKDQLPQDIDNMWELKGLNEQLKIYKYEVGQEFKLHRDAPFIRNEEERSFYTMLIYLNDDYEGGETFFMDGAVKGGVGECVIFWQNMLHAGLIVSDGIKYAIRTDVMYVKKKLTENKIIEGKHVEIQAPNEYLLEDKDDYTKIFLAGSIEMGKAIMWQPDLISKLSDEKVLFYNPRRNDWNSSWEQKKENPQFNEQVTWELTKLEESDIIVMVIDPNTISPVTLIEFGLHIRSGKLIVYCPEGYFKKGNVDITSDFYGSTMVNSMDELIETIKGRL